MHGRLALALLLVLPLLAPAAASGAVPPHREIRKVEAITTSAGALVRVTLRAPLKGRLRVSFKRRDGVKGSTRRAAVIHGRKRTDFVFAGDARSLARVIVRTAPRGDRATLRLPRVKDDCAALTKLARKLRPLRKGRPAIKRRLSAISRRRNACGGASLPVVPGPTPPPGPTPAPVFTAPAAGFTLAHGETPDDPVSAGADLTFTDASQGSELIDRAWNFGDGTPASGQVVHHTYAQPGRYTVLLTVRNARGQTSAFGRELFVRGPGTATFDGDAVACPGPGVTDAGHRPPPRALVGQAPGERELHDPARPVRRRRLERPGPHHHAGQRRQPQGPVGPQREHAAVHVRPLRRRRNRDRHPERHRFLGLTSGFSSGTSQIAPSGGSVISAENAWLCHGIGSASTPP